MFAFIPLFIASVAFWSLYQRQFTVLTIYSDSAWTGSSVGSRSRCLDAVDQPVVIITLSGVFAAIWTKLGHRQPATPLKFVAGTMAIGLAFLLILPFVGAAPTRTPPLALIGIVLVFTLAELLLSPVGLLVTTKLAPEAFHPPSLGTAISGELARLSGIAIGIGALLAVASPWVLKLMRGVR